MSQSQHGADAAPSSDSGRSGPLLYRLYDVCQAALSMPDGVPVSEWNAVRAQLKQALEDADYLNHEHRQTPEFRRVALEAALEYETDELLVGNGDLDCVVDPVFDDDGKLTHCWVNATVFVHAEEIEEARARLAQVKGGAQ